MVMRFVRIRATIKKGSKPARSRTKTQGGLQANFLLFRTVASAPHFMHTGGKSLSRASNRAIRTEAMGCPWNPHPATGYPGSAIRLAGNDDRMSLANWDYLAPAAARPLNPVLP